MTLKAFNETHAIGAAHFERAVVFDCNEDCFVSVYANCGGAAGATLQIVMFDRAAQVPGQPTPGIITSVVDLSTASNKLAAAMAFSAGCVLEARSFGIDSVDVGLSALADSTAAPSATPIR